MPEKGVTVRENESHVVKKDFDFFLLLKEAFNKAKECGEQEGITESMKALVLLAVMDISLKVVKVEDEAVADFVYLVIDSLLRDLACNPSKSSFDFIYNAVDRYCNIVENIRKDQKLDLNIFFQKLLLLRDRPGISALSTAENSTIHSRSLRSETNIETLIHNFSEAVRRASKQEYKLPFDFNLMHYFKENAIEHAKNYLCHDELLLLQGKKKAPYVIDFVDSLFSLANQHLCRNTLVAELLAKRDAEMFFSTRQDTDDCADIAIGVPKSDELREVRLGFLNKIEKTIFIFKKALALKDYLLVSPELKLAADDVLVAEERERLKRIFNKNPSLLKNALLNAIKNNNNAQIDFLMRFCYPQIFLQRDGLFSEKNILERAMLRSSKETIIKLLGFMRKSTYLTRPALIKILLKKEDLFFYLKRFPFKDRQEIIHKIVGMVGKEPKKYPAEILKKVLLHGIVFEHYDKRALQCILKEIDLKSPKHKRKTQSQYPVNVFKHILSTRKLDLLKCFLEDPVFCHMLKESGLGFCSGSIYDYMSLWQDDSEHDKERDIVAVIVEFLDEMYDCFANSGHEEDLFFYDMLRLCAKNDLCEKFKTMIELMVESGIPLIPLPKLKTEKGCLDNFILLINSCSGDFCEKIIGELLDSSLFRQFFEDHRNKKFEDLLRDFCRSPDVTKMLTISLSDASKKKLAGFILNKYIAIKYGNDCADKNIPTSYAKYIEESKEHQASGSGIKKGKSKSGTKKKDELGVDEKDMVKTTVSTTTSNNSKTDELIHRNKEKAFGKMRSREMEWGSDFDTGDEHGIHGVGTPSGLGSGHSYSDLGSGDEHEAHGVGTPNWLWMNPKDRSDDNYSDFGSGDEHEAHGVGTPSELGMNEELRCKLGELKEGVVHVGMVDVDGCGDRFEGGVGKESEQEKHSENKGFDFEYDVSGQPSSFKDATIGGDSKNKSKEEMGGCLEEGGIGSNALMSDTDRDLISEHQDLENTKNEKEDGAISVNVNLLAQCNSETKHKEKTFDGVGLTKMKRESDFGAGGERETNGVGAPSGLEVNSKDRSGDDDSDLELENEHKTHGVGAPSELEVDSKDRSNDNNSDLELEDEHKTHGVETSSGLGVSSGEDTSSDDDSDLELEDKHKTHGIGTPSELWMNGESERKLNELGEGVVHVDMMGVDGRDDSFKEDALMYGPKKRDCFGEDVGEESEQEEYSENKGFYFGHDVSGQSSSFKDATIGDDSKNKSKEEMSGCLEGDMGSNASMSDTDRDLISEHQDREKKEGIVDVNMGLLAQHAQHDPKTGLSDARADTTAVDFSVVGLC